MNGLRWVAPFLLGALAACGGGERQEPASDPAATSEVAEASQLTGDELAAALADANVFLLDVRNPDELEELGTVKGYVNIPIDELADRLDELPRDRPILTA